MLDELFPWGLYKNILSFPKLNIYSDVAPFAETAVIINFREQISRKDMIKSYKAVNYINAETPFGLIIATQGP